LYGALSRQLDTWENEAIPKVAISTNSLVFPKVHFDTPLSQTLRIENTGQVVVQFHFHPKLQEESFCKPWLGVKPEFGIIPPKETAEIVFTVHIDRRTAHPLLTGQDVFEDILILKLENGRDYFVSVTGEYLKSSFGAHCEFLCNVPYPVRFAPPDKQPVKVLSIPKELWRLVDYIFRYGMDAVGLFVTAGNAIEIERVRDCLDTGKEFSKFGIHSVAEALVRFHDNLAEPIFPASLCNQFSEGMNLTAWCMQALTQLSPAHYNAFIYMASFLREILKHSDKNLLTANQLVLVFSRCLMHADVSGAVGKPKPWIILHHFLTSSEFI